MAKDALLVRALQAKKESKYIDFKESFNPDSLRDWVEIIKDVVAMANSGGGVLVFGVKNNGQPSGFDVDPLLRVDPAHVTDKVARYTGEQFSEFAIEEGPRDGNRVGLLRVFPVTVPLIFTKPGSWDLGGGRSGTAFGVGTVYFRHGAKSEPGNANDLRQSVERELDRIRESWLGNIRKVVEAPVGRPVQVVPADAGDLTPTRVRIVESRTAPAYGVLDPNLTHPYRLKETVSEVNSRLRGKTRINSHDLQCVRRVYGVDAQKKHFYKPKFGSPQYSQAFVEWVVSECQGDPDFFDKSREQYRNMQNQ